MTAYRGFIVLGVGVVLVLLPFLIFVAAGWPGRSRRLHGHHPNTCFCEAFNPGDVIGHASGVRQPVNTWFNLYSILTAALVALVIYLDRRDGRAARTSCVPTISSPISTSSRCCSWVWAACGSAPRSSIGRGISTGLSMDVYAAFLVFYTLRRRGPGRLGVLVLHPITAVVVFVILPPSGSGSSESLILIIALVAAYLALEIVACVREGKPWQGRWNTILLWWLAVGCIIAATVFWALSQSRRADVRSQRLLQPHGILWHPLAGAMAVLLYFCWRENRA